MLPEEQIKQIQDEIRHCKKPVFFFHDDPDGLCSFLLMYRLIGEGKGIVVKTKPNIGTMFARTVKEYGADKVFVLDIAMVEQDFIDEVKIPVVWIDHHGPYQRERVKYFNSRLQGENIPPSEVCYHVSEKDLWIAMAGCIGDWYIPTFKDKFCEQYPDLMGKEVTKPEDALFKTKLGELVKIMSFNLKGTTQEVMKSAKIFTRIETPYEILNQTTSRGAFIYKKYERVKQEYDSLLKRAAEKKTKDKILLYTYHQDVLSLTKELSNELLFMFPNKIIVIGREKSGEMKCSIRSGPKVMLNQVLEKALEGISGYGGGHEHACGAVIKTEDFEKFLENMRKFLKKQ